MKHLLLAFSLFFSNILFAKDDPIELKDIGIFNSKIPDEKFTTEMTDLRIEKLELHKRFAHATTGLMLATIASAIYGKKEIADDREKRGGSKSSSDAKNLNLHMGLSALTLLSYGTTAYFSLSAPKPQSYPDETKRVWHKGLAYIHGTAMALAPVLGFMAFKKYHDGKDPEGISKLHRPVMIAGSLAFFASFAVITF